MTNGVKLSQVVSGVEIPGTEHAIYPGVHCPLMGAAQVAGAISNSLMLIIGTAECSYYTKHFSIKKGNHWGPYAHRIVSLILDEQDIAFGCNQKFMAAIKEIKEEYNPKLLLAVTTCVVETTGDDIDGLAFEASQQWDMNIVTVHTAHYKCHGHEQGIAAAWEACTAIMNPSDIKSGVGLLGGYGGAIHNTELYKVLQHAGVPVHTSLCGNCTCEDIEKAAQVNVNIVLDNTFLPMAKKMKTKFGIPFVSFADTMEPDNIKNCYEQIFQYLALPVPKLIAELHRQTVEKISFMQKELQGKQYVYEASHVPFFATNIFLIELGLKPLLLCTGSGFSKNKKQIQYLVTIYDPYIAATLDAPLAKELAAIKYDYFWFGNKKSRHLPAGQTNISLSDKNQLRAGFEYSNYLLDIICKEGNIAIPTAMPENGGKT